MPRVVEVGGSLLSCHERRRMELGDAPGASYSVRHCLSDPGRRGIFISFFQGPLISSRPLAAGRGHAVIFFHDGFFNYRRNRNITWVFLILASGSIINGDLQIVYFFRIFLRLVFGCVTADFCTYVVQTYAKAAFPQFFELYISILNLFNTSAQCSPIKRNITL